MRLLLARAVVVAIVLALCTLGASAALAATPKKVQLPRDHYGHASGIEWWYFTGLLKGSDGKRYSTFFTVFASQGIALPVSQVVDLETGAIVGHTETAGPAKISSTGLDVRLPQGSLRYAKGAWRFGTTSPGYGIDVTATPRKPYVLHGKDGYIKQSSAGLSGYYSNTRLAATGTLTTAAGAVKLSGQMWLDHQWGNFQASIAALNWDWFSCRFDDRTELMLYTFRGPDGSRLAQYRNGTFVRKDGRSVGLAAFDVAAGERLFDGAGRTWPLDWRLTVPSQNIDVQLTSPVEDQLVRGTLLPTFFEGVAFATGSHTGTCFVEQSYR
jgi:predicted secreted hydrolase